MTMNGTSSVLMWIVSSITMAVSQTVDAAHGSPVTLVPTVNLVAIIGGSIAMGMLFNRVKQLERSMDECNCRRSTRRRTKVDRRHP